MGKLVSQMTPEEHEHRKEQRRLMYRKNKEKEAEYAKQYYEQNKEKISDYNKQYNKDNFNKIAEQKKAYRATEKGTKIHRIGAWKGAGVICDDWDALYKTFCNTWNCENCNDKLVEERYKGNKKCLDHDHTTGLFRAILCSTCNVNRRNEI